MSKQPTPRQRRSQRVSVEDRWCKRIKDADGNSVEVDSAVAGQVTRWRARYVDNAGREHTRHFDRKVEAQQWLNRQLAALLRGDHVAPSDAMMIGRGVVRQVAGGLRHAAGVDCPAGRGARRDHQDTLRLGADVRAEAVGRARLDGQAQDGGESRLVPLRDLLTLLPDLHRRWPRRDRRAQPVLAADLAGMGKQRPYVATTRQVWALYDAVPPGVRLSILLGAHAGFAPC